MAAKSIGSEGRFSKQARILLPINIISMLALTFLCVVIITQTRNSFNQAMQTKIDTSLAVMDAASRDAFINFDVTVLEHIAKTNLADSDLRQIKFVDTTGETRASAGIVPTQEELHEAKKDIKTNNGRVLGNIELTYSKDRIQKLFLTVLLSCLLCALFVQGVIFAISRRTIKIELEKSAIEGELKVQSAIAAESKKVKVLVDNMQQALFSVASDGTIVDPVSKYTDRVLGQNVVGQGLIPSLYKGCNKETQDAIQSAVSVSFGEDLLQWDLIESSFPRKINCYNASDQNPNRILKVLPSPILDDASKIEKILFVAEDVTDLELLEEQLKKQRAEAAILEEILNSDLEEARKFLSATTATLAEYKSENAVGGQDQFLRDLHSAKGVARSHGLRKLSQVIHEAESQLATLKSENKITKESIPSVLTSILGQISEYTNILKKVSRVSNSNTAPESISSHPEFGLLRRAITDLANEPSKKQIQRLQETFYRLSNKSLKSVFESLEKEARALADELGKQINFQVTGDAIVTEAFATGLQEAILQLVRNSVDHGLGTPDQRLKLGKPSAGNIRINLIEDSNGIKISVSDDGEGIDSSAVLRKAIKDGIITEDQSLNLSQQEKTSLIFANGFSTKDRETEISGRGIGLDLAKQRIEAIGGRIELDSEAKTGVTIKISVPTPRFENLLKDSG